MRQSKGELTNVITDFETKGDSDYSYTRIAQTKDKKITFFRAKLIKDQHKKSFVSNEVYIVAKCSQEDMKNIINSKLDKNHIYVKDKNVYFKYTEDDFDKTEADEMKKYIKFPLYLDYSSIYESIFDYNIDKDTEYRITSILDGNEKRKIDTNNNSLNKNENNTSHNDDLKNKTAQQLPYYKVVWNKLFGGCCPCGLNSTKQERELKND